MTALHPGAQSCSSQRLPAFAVRAGPPGKARRQASARWQPAMRRGGGGNKEPRPPVAVGGRGGLPARCARNRSPYHVFQEGDPFFARVRVWYRRGRELGGLVRHDLVPGCSRTRARSPTWSPEWTWTVEVYPRTLQLTTSVGPKRCSHLDSPARITPPACLVDPVQSSCSRAPPASQACEAEGCRRGCGCLA